MSGNDSPSVGYPITAGTTIAGFPATPTIAAPPKIDKPVLPKAPVLGTPSLGVLPVLSDPKMLTSLAGKSTAPMMPKVQGPALMPAAGDANARNAGKRAAEELAKRNGRQSTILTRSAPRFAARPPATILETASSPYSRKTAG